jgi:hypothetical protein
LYDSNDVLLESKTISETVASGANGTTTFETALSNLTTYKVDLKVVDSLGLWSVLTDVTFSTEFQTPPIPTIVCTMNLDGGYVSVDITNPSPGAGEATTDYNQLYRSVDGITYELVDNIPINTTVIDYVPGLAGGTTYYVIAVSDTPSINTSIVTTVLTILNGCFFLNSGAGYEDYIKLIGDVNLTDNINRDTITKNFEGREYPLKYQGTNLVQNISFSCDVPKSNYNTLINVVNQIGNLMYRDWYGRRFNCSIKDLKVQLKDNIAYQMSCTIERVGV